VWVIGFIEHLQIVTASNYSVIAYSHTLQFTTARTKSAAFAGCLVTASKAVDSSASMFTSLMAGDCLTTNLALLRNGVQQWGLLSLLRLRQGVIVCDDLRSRTLLGSRLTQLCSGSSDREVGRNNRKTTDIVHLY
jgi:hypothetical protein